MLRAASVALAIASVLASPGCFFSDGSSPPAGSGHDARFAGDWHIGAAEGWALLATSTVYRLHPGGDLEVVFQRDGSYFEGPAGKWRPDAAGVQCELSDRWSSDGPTHLLIDSVCSDGVGRVAGLDFPFPASENTTRPAPQLRAAGGATALWDGPQGSFFRCTTEPSACPPF